MDKRHGFMIWLIVMDSLPFSISIFLIVIQFKKLNFKIRILIILKKDVNQLKLNNENFLHYFQ